MIILKDDILVHVDSSTDIIEHYGIKGMKWGSVRRARRQADKFNSLVKKEMKKRGLGDGTFSTDDIMKKYERDFVKVGNELIVKNPKYKNITRVTKLLEDEETSKGIYDYNKGVRQSESKAFKRANKVTKALGNASLVTVAVASSSQLANQQNVYQPATIGTIGLAAGQLASYGVQKGIERGITKDIRKRRKKEANKVRNQLKNIV
jgi:hypothetical protein